MTEESKKKKFEFMEYESLIVDGSPDKAGARALIAIAEELRRLNEILAGEGLHDPKKIVLQGIANPNM